MKKSPDGSAAFGPEHLISRVFGSTSYPQANGAMGGVYREELHVFWGGDGGSFVSRKTWK